ncbi:MAG: site-specific integrase [Anaerococcus hydrogenalis]|nr:site-specific integrase [Anaerococcus hydrogenalis]
MGRWDKKKKKYTLRKDMQGRLDSYLKNGKNSSRDRDKNNKEDLTQNKIYSYVTYKNYKRSCYKFADFLYKNHKEVRQLKDLKIKHVNNYLQYMVVKGYSAPTINSAKAAIAKLMQVSSKEFLNTPKVKRENITRSRGEAMRDKHISKATEYYYAKFTTAIGGRRSEMEELKGTDLVIKPLTVKLKDKNGNKYVKVLSKRYPQVKIRNGKGGKERFAPIFAKNKEELTEIINTFKKAENNKVFQKLPSHYDNHFYRGEYAKRAYKKFARPVRNINNKREVYFCRGDKAGEAYDRKAMLISSQFLGHNRVDVIARHYLY